jgi:flagellar basal body-associated protein FliL
MIDASDAKAEDRHAVLVLLMVVLIVIILVAAFVTPLIK